jgi:integrase/recombinase XerD
MRDPSRVRVTGPLELDAPGFAGELARQGYTPNSAAVQLQLMAHVSRWLAARGRDAAALDGEAVEGFLAARRAAGYTMFVSGRAMVPLLGYLRAVGAAPAAVAPAPGTPVELLLGRYRLYLLVERGLSAGTARGYVDAVRPFLYGREAAGGLRLGRLTAAEVAAFVVARCPGQARGSAKLTVTAMRSLWGSCTWRASSRGRWSARCRRRPRGGWRACRGRSSRGRSGGCSARVTAAARRAGATLRSWLVGAAGAARRGGRRARA